ncbi:MAG: hypothetical protein JWP12_221 [Bacteroidetes bacterium]|nr:hypothetical protein [Bacteroidota bacterium]
MEIKKNQENTTGIRETVLFIKKYKRFFKKVLLFCIVIGIITGGFIASKAVRTKGYTGLWDFAGTVASNYWKGMDANAENISIEIKEKDYKELAKNREKALERGVIINDIDGDYVPATLEYKGKKMDVKLRLKGHMTDHLQDNKWSFRVKIKGKDAFMGMKRFSIQHPGTRGYIYEWIYHQLMKQEDIIALRYKFINVSVNGKDWGIYAVEENFDPELIANNNRKPGPIIRFNPDLYWVDRYNEIENSEPVAEFASYYSANVEAYREDNVLEDSVQKKYYMKAIALMEGFRSRKLNVGQVFDIPRLAKFHAVIDLVGGQHSIDWSDLKYYYNPVTAKLEPVAYESFTQFPFQDISGNYKYENLDSAHYYPDLHTALFSDPEFFKAYIRELERISKPAYLDQFFSGENQELKKNLAIIYKEFPYKKFEKEGYYKNQKMIVELLSAPKAFQAYFDFVANNQVHLQIGAIESLPTEIKSISIGNSLGVPLMPIILPAKKRNKYVEYKEYVFTMPTGITWDDSLIQSLKVNYSVLGASTEQETKVFPFPHTDSEFIAEEMKNEKGNVNEFSFLTVDETRHLIMIKPGKQVVDKDLVIPAGYKLVANAGVDIDLKNNAKLVSYSALIFTGTEDQPVIIESSDSTAEGIEIINAPKSVWNYVTVRNLPKIHDHLWNRTGGITFYESPFECNYSSFYHCKAEDCINLIRSTFSFKECLFHKMHDDALDADYSEGTVTNCVFEKCAENALDIMLGKITVTGIYVDGAGNKALNIKAGTQLKGSGVKIKNARIAISGEDESTIDLKDVQISDSEIGLVAYKNKPGAGHARVTVTGLKLTNVKKNYLREKKSTIVANGISITEDVDDVEAIIKGDKKKRK